MRRLMIFTVLILLAGAALFAFERTEWQTVARLFVKPGSFYFLEKSGSGDYRLFLSAENASLILGKGSPDSRGTVFTGPERTKVMLFTKPGQPELNGVFPKPGLLPFVEGFTCSFSEKPSARLGALAGRTSTVIAGSFKNDSILLEETGTGGALPFYDYPSHFIYLEESAGRYKRFTVVKVANENLKVFYARRGGEELTLSIDWNEQGKAVGKIVFPDASTALLDCGFFSDLHDEPVEERE